LLDPGTLALAAAIEPIIAGEKEHGPAKRVLMQCQAEVSGELVAAFRYSARRTLATETKPARGSRVSTRLTSPAR
jgi:hypothetical protein